MPLDTYSPSLCTAGGKLCREANQCSRHHSTHSISKARGSLCQSRVGFLVICVSAWSKQNIRWSLTLAWQVAPTASCLVYLLTKHSFAVYVSMSSAEQSKRNAGLPKHDATQWRPSILPLHSWPGCFATKTSSMALHRITSPRSGVRHGPFGEQHIVECINHYRTIRLHINVQCCCRRHNPGPRSTSCPVSHCTAQYLLDDVQVVNDVVHRLQKNLTFQIHCLCDITIHLRRPVA